MTEPTREANSTVEVAQPSSGQKCKVKLKGECYVEPEQPFIHIPTAVEYTESGTGRTCDGKMDVATCRDVAAAISRLVGAQKNLESRAPRRVRNIAVGLAVQRVLSAQDYWSFETRDVEITVPDVLKLHDAFYRIAPMKQLMEGRSALSTSFRTACLQQLSEMTLEEGEIPEDRSGKVLHTLHEGEAQEITEALTQRLEERISCDPDWYLLNSQIDETDMRLTVDTTCTVGADGVTAKVGISAKKGTSFIVTLEFTDSERKEDWDMV